MSASNDSSAGDLRVMSAWLTVLQSIWVLFDRPESTVPVKSALAFIVLLITFVSIVSDIQNKMAVHLGPAEGLKLFLALSAFEVRILYLEASSIYLCAVLLFTFPLAMAIVQQMKVHCKALEDDLLLPELSVWLFRQVGRLIYHVAVVSPSAFVSSLCEFTLDPLPKLPGANTGGSGSALQRSREATAPPSYNS
ncbi:hypothetical protein C8J56DRAFT_385084 [Mycena floridula]|nr:hypothetical protein C8J56DRAFT_385084 [Mycena floridula]